MPNRMLYAGLIGSQKVNQLKPPEFELYIRLILTVDDFGRYIGNPVRIARACWPDREDITSRTVQPMLAKLNNIGLLQLYQVDGETYLQMASWNQRTRTDASKFPPPAVMCPSNDGQMTVICPSSAHVDVDVDVDVGDRRIDGHFDLFWFAYPKKVGKQAAIKAWKQIKPKEDLLQKMLSAIEWQKQSDQWTKNSGQYIPNPATWLNQGRWDDELPRRQSEAERIMSL